MSAELKMYRFNFRPEFASLIFKFSHIHQYDSCTDFKEAFAEWEETHQASIIAETEYLEALGYVGDFRTKVFKSARYYFRKKSNGTLILDMDMDEAVLPAKKTKTAGLRKKYSSIDYDLSTKIAEFIENNYRLKPSDGFEQFLELHREEIETEVLRLEGEGEVSGFLKIKKTFKNKHFNKKIELVQQGNDNCNNGNGSTPIVV